MATDLLAFSLSPRNDNWDDLTELLEDLQQYTPLDVKDLYPIVQAIAEGKSADLKIYDGAEKDFVQHMREFKIDAIPSNK